MISPFDTALLLRIGTFFKNNLPFVLFLFGIVLVFISVVLGTGKTWGSAINTIGVTTLTAGVFSAVVKSRLFTEIFTSVVSDVVHGKEFVKKRTDLEVLWKNVSNEICSRRFPELTDDIHNRIIKEMLPVDRNHYYEYMERKFIINEYNEKKNFIKCQQSSTLIMVPYSDAKTLTYRYRYIPSQGSGATEEYFLIDDEPITAYKSKALKYNESGTDDPNTGMQIEIELPAGRYTIKKKKNSIIDLAINPWLKTTIFTYSVQTRVYAQSIVPEFYMRFISLGDRRLFRPLGNDAPELGHVAMESVGLLMPGEGHILVPVRQRIQRDGL